MLGGEDVQALLRSQREAFNDSITHLVSNFNTQFASLKAELDATKFELNETKQDVANKQIQIDQLSSKLEEFESAIESYKFDPVPLFNRLDSLEDHSRRNNLRIDGVPEKPRENWEQTSLEIKKLAEKIGIEHEVKIDRAHRLGTNSGSSRPRTIIARFHHYGDREFFLRNSYKLKGTAVFVNEDLCQTSLNIRKEKLPELQQARREGKTAYFSHTRLIIKEKAAPPPNLLAHPTGPLPNEPTPALSSSSAPPSGIDTGISGASGVQVSPPSNLSTGTNSTIVEPPKKSPPLPKSSSNKDKVNPTRELPNRKSNRKN